MYIKCSSPSQIVLDFFFKKMSILLPLRIVVIGEVTADPSSIIFELTGESSYSFVIFFFSFFVFFCNVFRKEDQTCIAQ